MSKNRFWTQIAHVSSEIYSCTYIQCTLLKNVHCSTLLKNQLPRDCKKQNYKDMYNYYCEVSFVSISNMLLIKVISQ